MLNWGLTKARCKHFKFKVTHSLLLRSLSQRGVTSLRVWECGRGDTLRAWSSFLNSHPSPSLNSRLTCWGILKSLCTQAYIRTAGWSGACLSSVRPGGTSNTRDRVTALNTHKQTHEYTSTHAKHCHKCRAKEHTHRHLCLCLLYLSWGELVDLGI